MVGWIKPCWARLVAFDSTAHFNDCARELVTRDHRDSSFVTGCGILSAKVEPLGYFWRSQMLVVLVIEEQGKGAQGGCSCCSRVPQIPNESWLNLHVVFSNDELHDFLDFLDSNVFNSVISGHLSFCFNQCAQYRRQGNKFPEPCSPVNIIKTSADSSRDLEQQRWSQVLFII
jgi:hypothetical protein